MMIVKFLVFVYLIFIFAACSSKNLEGDYSTSSTLAFNLLKICLAKTLNTYSESNTESYVLDLSKISTLNKSGVDSFLGINKSILPVLQDDSATILRSINETGSKVLLNGIVRFEEVEFIDKNHVYVVISKVRSRNQIIKLGLDLKRQGDSYKIFKSEIKR